MPLECIWAMVGALRRTQAVPPSWPGKVWCSDAADWRYGVRPRAKLHQDSSELSRGAQEKVMTQGSGGATRQESLCNLYDSVGSRSGQLHCICVARSSAGRAWWCAALVPVQHTCRLCAVAEKLEIVRASDAREGSKRQEVHIPPGTSKHTLLGQERRSAGSERREPLVASAESPRSTPYKWRGARQRQSGQGGHFAERFAWLT